MSTPQTVRPARPWTFPEAHAACDESRQAQATSEQEYGNAVKAAAKAKETYQKALTAEMWRLRKQGVAWSLLGDLARGEERVAQLRRLKDEAEGDMLIAKNAQYRMSADRRDCERFSEWGMRADLRTMTPHDPRLAFSPGFREQAA